MPVKLITRLSLDLIMTLLILLEFAYRLIGSTLHELIGLLMFTLIIVHGSWNWRWFATLLKGKYAVLRIVSVTINALLLITGLLMMVSGSDLTKSWAVGLSSRVAAMTALPALIVIAVAASAVRQNSPRIAAQAAGLNVNDVFLVELTSFS